MGIAMGEPLALGAIQIAVRASIDSEPDKLSGGMGFGPRLIISDEAVRASALLQPGSVVRWHYRLRLPADKQNEASVRAIAAEAQEKFPEAGWDIRSRSHAAPSLQQNIDRFTQYLTLVGLTALLIGGVGVANAVKAHLDRRRSVVAILNVSGCDGRGRRCDLSDADRGSRCDRRHPWTCARRSPAVHPERLRCSAAFGTGAYPGALARAFVFGMLVAVAFALWPLGRAHDMPVSALFRDEVAQDSGGTAPALQRGNRHGHSRRGRSGDLHRLRSTHRDHVRDRGGGRVRRAPLRPTSSSPPRGRASTSALALCIQRSPWPGTLAPSHSSRSD